MAHDNEKGVPTDKKPDNKANQVLPIVYDPAQVPAVYSDNALILHTVNEFILSFFQIEYPYMVSPSGDDKAEGAPPSDEVKYLTARCVSRVIMSPNQMIRLVNALQDNLAKYLKKAEDAKKANEAKEGA